MADATTPSYTELVYDVLRSAAQPLPFAEIMAQVEARRPITTRHPKGTIRQALTQVRTLVNTGDGRYGYLPHLLKDSVIALPLPALSKLRRSPLIFPEDLQFALWPAFFETGKRRLDRPVVVQLQGGPEVTFTREFFQTAGWGSVTPPDLIQYLEAQDSRLGDVLAVRVLDGEAGRAAAWVEPRRRRTKAVMARRNASLADEALKVLRERREKRMAIWELAISLLARGAYREDIAPDPLLMVLVRDDRFASSSGTFWMPADAVPPDMMDFPDLADLIDAEDLDLWPGMVLGEPPQPLGGRVNTERVLADMGALIASAQFDSIDQLNAYLRDVINSGGPPARPLTTPLERAQDLVYQAMEATAPLKRLHLARKALETSPDCADAYVLLAEEGARDAREAAGLYAQGVAAGERALGPRRFIEDAGHFWGILDTRPYMRARYGLALTLWYLQEHEAAIGHMQELLRLNPHDNQGGRYILLSWLLERGDDTRTQALLDQYRDEWRAAWLYGRALHSFRTKGDTVATRNLRTQAIRQNPFVPPYLLGRKRLPRKLPEFIGLGDEAEAVDCADSQIRAWQAAPGALDWLAEGVRGPAPRRAR